ncbi:MAG: methyl-accepting chemotaxis protein [Planctomycetaceae bacterium]
MPLWTRLALIVGLAAAAAAATASVLQALVARTAITEQSRAGAEGVADALARAVTLAGELPATLDAEIGEQLLVQGRLLAQLAAVAEQAGLPPADVDARLRQAAEPSGSEFVVTDATGTVCYASVDALGGFRFSDDPAAQPQDHVFHRLLAGDLPALVRESRRRDGEDRLVKEVGVPGVDGPRIVRVGLPTDYLERLERVAGLRRLAGEIATGDVREVRVVDARGTPQVTRFVDDRGNASETPQPLDAADAALVRECITGGRTLGRPEGTTYRAVAPVRRTDGVASGAVLVTLASRSDRWLPMWQGLSALAAALLAGIPAAIAAAWLGQRFAAPVVATATALDALAAGDLGADLPAGGDGEAGRLGAAAAGMAETLRDSLRRVQDSAARLSSEETEVSTALSRQERAVRGFSGAVADVSGAVNLIAANADHLLGATATVTVAAREATRVAVDGRAGLDSMSASMRELEEAMTAFTRKLATIRQRAGGITTVVTTIAKVAEQTNLLSVNATIEAEKAGEAGRGFRIVAQEIRRLADQTALATKDIERMVRDMQSAVSSGTMEMDRFRAEVSERITRVTQVGEQLARIVAPVESVTRSLEQLHDGMETQSAGARQVRESMERLRGEAGLSATTTESFARSIDGLRHAIVDLNDEAARFRVERTGSAGG